MSKRIIAILAVVTIVFVCVFAACGKQDGVYADEKDLERFIDYCTGYFQDGWTAHKALAILKEKTLPPQTGDPTAAYALIFTLAALPLAGLGVHEWKKRRRAV